MHCQLFQVVGLLAVLQAWPASNKEPPKQVFNLFPISKACGCVKPLRKIPGVIWNERREGRRIYQIFYESQTRRELFRFEVGNKVDNEWLKWWLYGIATHGDFNGDGIEDFSWSGGDDTSTVEYVVLSSAVGYRRVDVIATLEREWTRRYGVKSPDFTLGDPLWIGAVHLERVGASILLRLTVHDERARPRNRVLRFKVEEKDFALAKD